MRWPGIEQLYGEFLRQTPVFSIEKRWEDLHTRIIEHVREHLHNHLPTSKHSLQTEVPSCGCLLH